MNAKDTNEQTSSKSQRKREAQALQTLGEQLVALKPAQLVEIPLDEDLLAAVQDAQAIRSHSARRRQLQFIGKLMRSRDPEPIQAALDQLQQITIAAKHQQHRLERLLAALLAGEQDALTDFLQQYPNTDRQQLRQLIRKAQAEQGREQAPHSRRALWRFLRASIAAGT